MEDQNSTKAPPMRKKTKEHLNNRELEDHAAAEAQHRAGWRERAPSPDTHSRTQSTESHTALPTVEEQTRSLEASYGTHVGFRSLLSNSRASTNKDDQRKSAYDSLTPHHGNRVNKKIRYGANARERPATIYNLRPTPTPMSAETLAAMDYQQSGYAPTAPYQQEQQRQEHHPISNSPKQIPFNSNAQLSSMRAPMWWPQSPFPHYSQAPHHVQTQPIPIPANVGQAGQSQQYVRADSQQQPVMPLARMGFLTLHDIQPRHERGRTPPVAEPHPTREYLAKAVKDPTLLSTPQPLLIVFDLNGTLLYRPSRNNLTRFIPRPGLAKFVDWLMDADGKYGHRHRAMIWSSAKPENVQPMVNKLFTKSQTTKLAAVWARDKLGLTERQYYNKVQVYKELSKIWNDPTIDSFYPGYCYQKTDDKGEEIWIEENGWWDQTNCVLVDDSIKKAASEPHNLLQIPAFEDRPDQQNDVTLQAVRMYIEEVARYSDASAYMRAFPFSSMFADDDYVETADADGGV